MSGPAPHRLARIAFGAADEEHAASMGGTLIADMRDYEDEDSFLRETSGPALSLALFLGSIVGWVTSHPPGSYEQTNVPCRRRPRGRRCIADICARHLPDGVIAWECPVCGDNGFIRGWEDTLWNRRDG